MLRDKVLGRLIKTKNQYTVHVGQFVLSKIDARNGAFGIVTDNIEGAVITSNFWAFNVDECVVLKEYLQLLVSTKHFTAIWKDCSNGSGNRLYLDEEKFSKYRLPIPSIPEQQRILDEYHKLIAHAETLEAEAKALEDSIDEYLYSTLEIARVDVSATKFTGVLGKRPYSKLAHWGIGQNISSTLPEDLFVSNRFKNVPLSDVCLINPTTFLKSLKDTEITFLPMECISDKTGEIEIWKSGKALNADGYTKFKENDVLWAKITPCMQNGKCAVAKKLQNGYGYGSTEYNVFRVKNNEVLPEYIHAFLRTRRLRALAQQYFTGSSGQQRVSVTFFDGLTIPLIDVDSADKSTVTQSSIIKELHKIKDAANNKRNSAKDLRQEANSDFESILFA